VTAGRDAVELVVAEEEGVCDGESQLGEVPDVGVVCGVLVSGELVAGEPGLDGLVPDEEGGQPGGVLVDPLVPPVEVLADVPGGPAVLLPELPGAPESVELPELPGLEPADVPGPPLVDGGRGVTLIDGGGPGFTGGMCVGTGGGGPVGMTGTVSPGTAPAYTASSCSTSRR